MKPSDYLIYQELRDLVDAIKAYSDHLKATEFKDWSEIPEKMQHYIAEITRLQESFSLEAQEEFGDKITNIVETAILIQNGVERLTKNE